MGKRIFISKAKCWMRIVRVRFLFLLKRLFLIMLLITLTELEVKAAPAALVEGIDVPAFTFEGFPVQVIVQGYSSFYVDAIYANNELLYVNIEHLFKTLNIPCFVGQGGDRLNGFIENESRTYSVDYYAGQIKVGDKTIHAKKELVKEAGSLYMESSLFSEAFGISLT